MAATGGGAASAAAAAGRERGEEVRGLVPPLNPSRGSSAARNRRGDSIGTLRTDARATTIVSRPPFFHLVLRLRRAGYQAPVHTSPARSPARPRTSFPAP